MNNINMNNMNMNNMNMNNMNMNNMSNMNNFKMNKNPYGNMNNCPNNYMNNNNFSKNTNNFMNNNNVNKKNELNNISSGMNCMNNKYNINTMNNIYKMNNGNNYNNMNMNMNNMNGMNNMKNINMNNINMNYNKNKQIPMNMNNMNNINMNNKNMNYNNIQMNMNMNNMNNKNMKCNNNQFQMNMNNMNNINNMNNMNIMNNMNSNNMNCNNNQIKMNMNMNNMNKMNGNNNINNIKPNNNQIKMNMNIISNMNNNIYKNMNGNNSYNSINVKYITVFFSYNSNPIIQIDVNIKEKVSYLIEKYKEKENNFDPSLKFYFNNKVLNNDLSIEEAGIKNNSTIIVKKELINKDNIVNECMETDSEIEKVINIKFIKQPKCNNYENYSDSIYGLLKLCLLKEISSKLNDNQIYYLQPEIVAYIIKILKNGYIDVPEEKECIKEVLLKMRGSNIISFSKYVDEIIGLNELNNIMGYLDDYQFNEINDIKNRLSIYNEHIIKFEKEFEEAKKKSVFEFSIISLVIIEREDFRTFERERRNCPNRVDRILYHGTNIEPITNILTGYFRKSIEKGYQHGKGVYFTDQLDYCWFYGGEEGNRANKNKIPKINETFTLIACSTYYSQDGFRHVYNEKYTPKKNEINFAYAGCKKLETLHNPDERKFYGTEYVIWDLDQICPFISAKLERQEYCVIWRDPNFSKELIQKNKFDKIFKDFLKERIKYIEQVAKYNIYPCETSEEALNLIRRKKYNKIILISNVGDDFGGKKFVEEARKIIGNNVIALFIAYRVEHLRWITQFPNAIFSNEKTFYEEYLECFNDSDAKSVKENIDALIKKIENHYNVHFNFNNQYLDFPNYKESGHYSDLTF